MKKFLNKFIRSDAFRILVEVVTFIIIIVITFNIMMASSEERSRLSQLRGHSISERDVQRSLGLAETSDENDELNSLKSELSEEIAVHAEAESAIQEVGFRIDAVTPGTHRLRLFYKYQDDWYYYEEWLEDEDSWISPNLRKKLENFYGFY